MEELLPKKNYNCKSGAGLTMKCKPITGLIS